jgi:hypothetical protein
MAARLASSPAGTKHYWWADVTIHTETLDLPAFNMTEMNLTAFARAAAAKTW